MKNKLFLLVFALFCWMTAPSFAQEETVTFLEQEPQQPAFTPQTDKDILLKCGSVDNPIRVAGFVTNPPLGWVDVSNNNFLGLQAKGFTLSLFEKIAQEENAVVRPIGFRSYHEAITAVKVGHADVLLGTYYEPQKLEGFDLLYPSYLSNPFIVLFKKGKERPIQKWADLVGLKGVVRQEELIYPLIFPALPQGMEMTQVSGAKPAFVGLLDGTYDYILTSLYAGEAEIRRFKLMDDVVATQHVLTQPELFFAFGKNSPCRRLMERFSEKLRTLKTDKLATQSMIIKQIDDWGARFANDPSLIESLQAEAEAKTPQNPTDKPAEKTP